MDRLLRYLPHPRNEVRFELREANVTPLPQVPVAVAEPATEEGKDAIEAARPMTEDAAEGKNAGAQLRDTQGGRKKRRPVPPRSPVGFEPTTDADVTEGPGQGNRRSNTTPSLALLRSPHQRRSERRRDHYRLPDDSEEEEDEEGDDEGERKDEDTNLPVDQGGGDRGNGDRGRDSLMQ